MVRHDKEGFLAQTEPLAFHSGCDHLEGLARAHFMGKQGVAAIEIVGNGVKLMFSQRDLRVHARKFQMPAVVLTGPGRVEAFVVERHQCAAALRVLPYPLLKSILDGLLLLLGKGGLLGIEDATLLAIGVCYSIIDAHITQIQRIFQNTVCVGAIRTVVNIGIDVVVGNGVFSGYVPFCGKFGIIDRHGATGV